MEDGSHLDIMLCVMYEFPILSPSHIELLGYCEAFSYSRYGEMHVCTSCCDISSGENTDADVVIVALMLVLFVNTRKNHQRSLTEDVLCTSPIMPMQFRL